MPPFYLGRRRALRIEPKLARQLLGKLAEDLRTGDRLDNAQFCENQTTMRIPARPAQTGEQNTRVDHNGGLPSILVHNFVNKGFALDLDHGIPIESALSGHRTGALLTGL